MVDLRHGGPVEEPPQDVILVDWDLAMVHADMGAWLRAHPPCDCPGVCTCDEWEDPEC